MKMTVIWIYHMRSNRNKYSNNLPYYYLLNIRKLQSNDNNTDPNLFLKLKNVNNVDTRVTNNFPSDKNTLHKQISNNFNSSGEQNVSLDFNSPENVLIKDSVSPENRNCLSNYNTTSVIELYGSNVSENVENPKSSRLYDMGAKESRLPEPEINLMKNKPTGPKQNPFRKTVSNDDCEYSDRTNRANINLTNINKNSNKNIKEFDPECDPNETNQLSGFKVKRGSFRPVSKLNLNIEEQVTLNNITANPNNNNSSTLTGTNNSHLFSPAEQSNSSKNQTSSDNQNKHEPPLRLNSFSKVPSSQQLQKILRTAEEELLLAKNAEIMAAKSKNKQKVVQILENKLKLQTPENQSNFLNQNHAS